PSCFRPVPRRPARGLARQRSSGRRHRARRSAPRRGAETGSTKGRPMKRVHALAAAACGGVLVACAALHTAPQLAPAQSGTLAGCADLAARLAYPQAVFAASTVDAGALAVAGVPVAAHCRVTGRLRERTSAIDGQRYAIGFEMRLPQAWNGRFFYQANGGVDGTVV